MKKLLICFFVIFIFSTLTLLNVKGENYLKSNKYDYQFSVSNEDLVNPKPLKL